MKVSQIEIKDFQQFKDFQVDLTYPKGHKKAGEPLDKVCFIGQSGTGKTTLLTLLKESIILNKEIGYFDDKFYDGEINIFGTVDKKYNFFLKKYHEAWDFEFLTKKDTLPEKYINWIDDGERKLLYLPYGLNTINQPHKKEETEKQIGNEYYYKVDSETIYKTWKDISDRISDYQKQKTDFRLRTLNRFENEEFDLRKSLRKWESDNPSPLVEFAENFLDKILNQIYLKVKTDIDSLKELDSIPIETINTKKTIKYEQLSSGTRQLILTTLPVHLLDSKDAIILIDEPETSLYPDIQRQIVPTYSDLAPEAQFFYATHSPVILSSFEPWEIVVLEFDNEGFVQPKKMYKGERHVDNYVANPRYLRWDDILMTYLGLDEEGSEERAETLQELSILSNKLKHLNGGNDELKKRLYAEYQEKAKKLNTNDHFLIRVVKL